MGCITIVFGHCMLYGVERVCVCAFVCLYWSLCISSFSDWLWGETMERDEAGQVKLFRRAALVLQDLSGPPITRHASLRCPLVGAHLKANHTLPLLELFIRELPPVFLWFPAHSQTDGHNNNYSKLEVWHNVFLFFISVIPIKGTLKRFYSLVKPGRVTFVIAIVLRHSQAA